MARSVLLLCSNNYLGLAGHPALRTAAAEAAQRWGAGTGASPLVSGHMALHRRLEAELAAFKGAETCVLFGSGFLANTGVLAALAGRGEVILSDALNHASIVDGCRLSRAETIVYAHADLDALRQAGNRQAVIVTDAVFSMDGDLAPLQGIVELARSHGARVVVDEAHATGVVGPGGRGLAAELSLERGVDVVIGTLGKALGSYGAFACCNTQTADYLVNRARTLIYSTALPPPRSVLPSQLLSCCSSSRRSWTACKPMRACCARSLHSAASRSKSLGAAAEPDPQHRPLSGLPAAPEHLVFDLSVVALRAQDGVGEDGCCPVTPPDKAQVSCDVHRAFAFGLA